MKMLTKRLGAVALVLAALVSMTTLTTAGAADGTWTGGPVTIRVELDLPDYESSGPLVQQVTNVIPGDQVELTSADIVDNPSDWYGTVWVDIDPEMQTVQVSTGQVPEDPDAEPTPTSPVTGLQPGFEWDSDVFQIVTVTISGAGFETLTLVSDDLWIDDDDGDEPANTIMSLVDVSASDAGDGRIAWAPTPADEVASLNTPGASLFAYGLPKSEEPTTTVSVPTTEAPPATEAPPTTVAPAVAKPAAAVTRTPTYTG